MARRGARGDPRSARLGTRGQELHDLAGRRQRDGRPHAARCSCARTSRSASTASSRGAYRDIPLAQDVSASDVEVSEGGTAYSPGGDTTLGSSDAPGTFGSVRLPQGLRIVWHYQQDGGQRTFTLALPPARRRDRPRRRGRGGPAGLGQPVELRAPPAARRTCARQARCPARAPGSSRPGWTTA